MINEHFKNQIDEGATEMFLYALETTVEYTARMMWHKGTLDTFPNLEYVKHLSEGVPLFKEHFNVEL